MYKKAVKKAGVPQRNVCSLSLQSNRSRLLEYLIWVRFPQELISECLYCVFFHFVLFYIYVTVCTYKKDIKKEMVTSIEDFFFF